MSLASIFDRGFLSPVRNQTFQPQNLYNLTVYTTNEREKREKEKKIARKFSTVGHSSVSSSEKERVKKRDREKEENNKLLSLPFSLESKCIWFKTSIPGWSINRTRNSWREEKSPSVISMIWKCVGRNFTGNRLACFFARSSINRFDHRDTSLWNAMKFLIACPAKRNLVESRDELLPSPL